MGDVGNKLGLHVLAFDLLENGCSEALFHFVQIPCVRIQ